MAIIGRLTPIAFALIFAMSGAIGPIIGQNFGAGQHRRVRQAFNSRYHNASAICKRINPGNWLCYRRFYSNRR